MTQPTSSRRASASGTKFKDNWNTCPDLAYNLGKNSVGLVYPSVLNSFFEDTRSALNQARRQIISTESSKNFDVRENDEPKYEVYPNRGRRTVDVALDSEVKELSDFFAIGETSSVRKNENCKTKKTSKATKNEVLPTRVLRSAGKYAEFKRELKSVNDFSIENIDWYYEHEYYYKKKLQIVMSDFTIPKENRRQGNKQLSYTYLLLDSRKCRNKANISWLDFIEAIFYVGKGKSDRAFKHAEEAEKFANTDNKNGLKIRKIWDSGNPITVFIVTENVTAEEAFTREAAMIEAMGLRRLCNRIHGSYYGIAVTMKARERLELGATLVVEARNIVRWKKTVDIYPKKKTASLSLLSSKGATVLIDPKENLKKEKPENEVSLHTFKSSQNIAPQLAKKKQSDIILVKDKSPSSTNNVNLTKSTTIDNKSTPAKVITTKTEANKTTKPTALEPKDNIVKTTFDAQKYIVLPASDFSIENMDWYYKNENEYKKKLQTVLSDFAIPKKNRREGNERHFYNFLLLDSKICKNKTNISWLDFIKAIFYIGKGKNDRAVKLVKEAEKVTTKKDLYLRIKDIWNSGNSVMVFLVTENIIAEEAFTRTAAMIDAMSLNRLCNERRGSYYDKAKTMKPKECLEFGATLLVEARDKFRRKKTIDLYPKTVRLTY